MILAAVRSVIAADISSPGKYGHERHINHQFGLRYITLSAGAGAWSKSWQPGMEGRLIPCSIIAEYGRTSFPLSITAGAIIRNTYTLDRFLLNPNNFIAGIRYAPLTGKKVAEKFNIYCTGGISVCYARFTEEINPGIVDYEYKIEKEYGAGLVAGAGAGYRIRQFEIRPSLFYFTGSADFFAGHFTRQHFDTGSMQLHLMICYRMIFNPNRRTCPVYHRYRRI